MTIEDFNYNKKCDHLLWELNEREEFTSTSMEENCSRCGNFNMYYDWCYEGNGVPVFITPTEKPKKDLDKLMLTEKGDNSVVPNYGLGLDKLIGEKFLTPVINRVRLEVLSSLEYLVALQKLDFYYSELDRDQMLSYATTSNLNYSTPGILTLSAEMTLENGQAISTVTTKEV